MQKFAEGSEVTQWDPSNLRKKVFPLKRSDWGRGRASGHDWRGH